MSDRSRSASAYLRTIPCLNNDTASPPSGSRHCAHPGHLRL